MKKSITCERLLVKTLGNNLLISAYTKVNLIVLKKRKWLKKANY
jgi:hypothetical protein